MLCDHGLSRFHHLVVSCVRAFAIELAISYTALDIDLVILLHLVFIHQFCCLKVLWFSNCQRTSVSHPLGAGLPFAAFMAFLLNHSFQFPNGL